MSCFPLSVALFHNYLHVVAHSVELSPFSAILHLNCLRVHEGTVLSARRGARRARSWTFGGFPKFLLFT